MVRIRYEKTNDEHILRSVRNIYSKSTGAMYSIYINTKDCTYQIKSILGQRSYYGGENINHLHVLKRNIKTHLEKLGVEFGNEIRNVEEKDE